MRKVVGKLYNSKSNYLLCVAKSVGVVDCEVEVNWKNVVGCRKVFVKLEVELSVDVETDHRSYSSY